MTLQAPHCLLMGPAGSGKTTAFATFARKGIECFVVVTEPTGVDSLIDAWEREKLDLDLLHYCVIAPTSPGWQGLKEMAVKVNAMNYKDLSELKSGVGKETMKQYSKLIHNFENFHDDRTGKDFGDITTWDAKRVLGVDSLSGLSLIALQNAVGFKPSPHQGEWGIAMSSVENLVLKLSSDCKCFLVLTAHIEKEPDEISGVAKIGVSTLGRKLAPKIPRFFSEVIRARKDPTGRFLWSTLDTESDLKNRALATGSSLEADFGPVIDAYRRRAQVASPAIAFASPAA